ncbi:MAG: HAMP domain-containing histidine kinase [Oscillospiraceae bacterium]|nr:HAMP domain-containing histidine kinase [Oscillospiraceae bacterium]
MKSLYRRQFVIMAGMILISFALLGAAFITLSYQYTVREKRQSMSHIAANVADYTATIFTSELIARDQYFPRYVTSMAQAADAYVMICTTNGQIFYSSDGQHSYTPADYYAPEAMVQQLLETGSYEGVSNMGGLFSERLFVAGTVVTLNTLEFQTGQAVITPRPIGLVFVAAETSSMTELWRAFASIFFFAAVVVLCIAFITSSVTSHRQTKPLKEIAEAARKFGHGELKVRVSGYESRRDEVGELAEAFNTMADSLAQSEARRSEFIANVSHELKTPMTTIAGFADGILDGTIPREQERKYLQTISSETRRLSRLVRRMLDLSRLQSSENITAQEQFDISEIMLRVLVSLENKINGRHLDVDTELPETPVLVWGDPDAITQVCYNLLDNAIKFSTEGTTLGIRVTPRGGKAYVLVRNTGETIPPEELTLLFDRFHKTDRSRSEDREGVGLGLYIVKTILGSHRENITVTSADGVTEFTFTLTLA